LDFFEVHPDLVVAISFFFTESNNLDWRYLPIDEIKHRAAHTTTVVNKAHCLQTRFRCAPKGHVKKTDLLDKK